MKKLITIILLMFSLIGYSQTDCINLQPINNINLYQNNLKNNQVSKVKFNFKYGRTSVDVNLGIGMMIGGVALTTAGLLTTSVTEEDIYGNIVNKPFWEQGSKMLAITSGTGLFIGGLTIALSGY